LAETPSTPTTRNMASGKVTRSWWQWGFCLYHQLCFGCYAKRQHEVADCPGPAARGPPPGFTPDWVARLPSNKPALACFRRAAAAHKEEIARCQQGEGYRAESGMSCLSWQACTLLQGGACEQQLACQLVAGAVGGPDDVHSRRGGQVAAASIDTSSNRIGSNTGMLQLWQFDCQANPGQPGHAQPLKS
jgi:hypothetical protein